MPDLIRANRASITDRFPIVSFTVRTETHPRWFEVAVATDPGLFSAEAKVRRDCSNFFSSRTGGVMFAPRGEGTFVLPPEVLRRFVGKSRLYYALATFASADRKGAKLSVLPSNDGPFVTVASSFERLEGSVATCPAEALVWAGDEVKAAESTERAAPIDLAVPPQEILIEKVPLVGQQQGLSSWAAAAAMLAGWRDGVSSDAGGIMQFFGAWARYLPQGLRPRTIAALCAAWKLVELPAVERSAADVSKLLAEHGPLWIGSTKEDRALVIRGIRGDGSGANTHVEVNDPSTTGSSQARSLKFAELARDFAPNEKPTLGPAWVKLSAPLAYAERK